MTDPHQIPAALHSLSLRPLFAMNVAVGAIHAPGGPRGAELRVGDVTGGHFFGDRLSGTIQPGGTDWQTVREDGTILLDARIVLQTDDGASIAMQYEGIRRGPPYVMARLAAGEPVDPADYYFRTTPRFTTAAPRYRWLNDVLAVGTGHRLPHGPIYQIFEIL